MEALLEAAKAYCLNFDKLDTTRQIEVLKRIEPEFMPEEYYPIFEHEMHSFGLDDAVWGEYVKYYLNY
jgi:hypothetical protein